jgi:hypothetical protein
VGHSTRASTAKGAATSTVFSPTHHKKVCFKHLNGVTRRLELGTRSCVVTNDFLCHRAIVIFDDFKSATLVQHSSSMAARILDQMSKRRFVTCDESACVERRYTEPYKCISRAPDGSQDRDGP